jgi:xylulokinase
VLALDLGSGGPKAAIVSNGGKVIASAGEKTTTYLLPGGGAEQDPDEWWSGTRKAVRKVIREAGVPADKIVAVACASQWSVVVPVDENGEPLMRAVHWLDHRGGPYNHKIYAGFPSIQGYGLAKLLKWIRLTGFPPTHSGADSLGHVLFIKNERPEIYANTYKFLEPMDYLVSRLTGKITATQKTMAPFLIVDNRQWGSCEYSEALLNLAGVEKDKFPQLLPNDGIVGPLLPAVAEELGLQSSTRVITGISDSNASIIGSGAVLDFESIIYIGTSQYMTCHLPFKKTDIGSFMATIPSPFKSRYYLFGEQLTGGQCVEFYLNNLIYCDDNFDTGFPPQDCYERFDMVASQAPAGSGGVIFMPWLNGSGVPEENSDARGGFINFSLKTTRTHLTRAIMEGLAFNNRWTKGPAEKFMGRSIEYFRFSGGGALSEVFSQIHADVLNVPIHQVEDPLNTTVRGAALLALVILGYRALEELPDLVRIKKVFEPDEANREIYDTLYRQYCGLFKRNRKMFAALNG